MRLAALGLLALGLAAPAYAGADRPPSAPRPAAKDPAMEPVLKELETRMAGYEDVESASIQVPAQRQTPMLGLLAISSAFM